MQIAQDELAAAEEAERKGPPPAESAVRASSRSRNDGRSRDTDFEGSSGGAATEARVKAQQAARQAAEREAKQQELRRKKELAANVVVARAAAVPPQTEEGWVAHAREQIKHCIDYFEMRCEDLADYGSM